MVEGAYVWVVPHVREKDAVEDNGRNVDACEEEVEDLHGGVHSVKVVEDTEVDTLLEASHMSAHAANRWNSLLYSEADLLQQLSYYLREQSRDATKDSMDSHGEDNGMTWEGMSDCPGAYFLL